MKMSKYNRLRNIVYLCMVVMLFSSCEKKQTDKSMTEMKEIGIFEKIDQTGAEKAEIFRKAEEEIIDETVFDVLNESKKSISITIHSVNEYLRVVDTDYLDDEYAYWDTKPVKAYDAFLSSEIKSLKEKNNYIEEPRIALGLIDGNDIPELFLSFDKSSSDGIWIYTYDPDSDSVISLGEFSQYGLCRYGEKRNRIWSQYGDKELHRSCFSEIKDNKPSLVGSVIITEDISNHKKTAYAPLPVYEDMDGTVENTYCVIPENKYKSSVKMFNIIYNEYRNCGESDRWLTMSRDDMIPITYSKHEFRDRIWKAYDFEEKNMLFVGDSRTIDMFGDSDEPLVDHKSNGIAVYARHGFGYDYLVEVVNGYGLDGFDILVTWMGANDAGDFSRYAYFYEELIAKGKTVILCTVGPTKDGKLEAEDHPNYENERMRVFNTSLTQWAARNGVDVIDLYEYIRDNIEIDDADGIHYNPRPTWAIWNHILKELQVIID